MRLINVILPTCLAFLLGACGTPLPRTSMLEWRNQVENSERAFAATMARRDHAGFITFLSDEAIFISGATALHGKQKIDEVWRRYYEKPTAPFSWVPDQIEVLESGNLALSSGPVYDPKGNLIARFNSIWRQESPGIWRIVFDKGNEVCLCEK